MGLAVGDDTTGVVSPLEIVEYPGAAAGARLIADAAARAGAVTVVIGLPTLDDGSVASGGRRTDRVAEELRALGVDVVLQSEFLTTNEARRRARMAGRSPRLPVDDLAAQVILEEFFETHRAGSKTRTSQ